MAGAGVMEVFTPDTTVPLRCGMQLTLSADGNDIFSGYIFTLESSRFGRTLTAADGIRYLLCRDTKVYANITAAGVVRDICGERGLTLAGAEDYGVTIQALSPTGRRCWISYPLPVPKAKSSAAASSPFWMMQESCG